MGIAVWISLADTTAVGLPGIPGAPYSLSGWKLQTSFDTNPAALLPGFLDLVNGEYVFTVRSNDPLLPGSTLPRSELREEIERIATLGSTLNHIAPVEVATGIRTIILQGHDLGGKAVFKVEVQGGTPGAANGILMLRYYPTAADAQAGTNQETRPIRSDVAFSAGGVSEEMRVRVKVFHNRVEFYHGANMNGATPDFTSGDAGTAAFSRTASDPDYNWKRGDYLQNNSASPVYTAKVYSRTGTESASTTLATVPVAFGAADWSVADAATGGAANITVSALPANAGAAITAIQYQVNGGTWTALGGATTGTYGISGLTNGAAATIALRAVNSVGNSAASATKSVTPTAGATAPAAFTAGMWTVSNLGTGGTARIAISSLPSNGGSAITALQRKIGAGAWTSLGGTTVGNYDVSGFTDGSPTDVLIRAVNAIGNGPDSDTKSVTTSVADTTPPEITAMSAGAESGGAIPITLTLTEAATVSWVLTTSATKPTPAQVAAGQNHLGAAAAASGSFAASASGTFSATLPSGLNGSYYLHASPIDAAGNRSLDVDTAGPMTINTASGLTPGGYGDARTGVSQTTHTFDSATPHVTQALPVTYSGGKYGLFVGSYVGVPSSVTIDGVAATKTAEHVDAPENASFWEATIPGGGSGQIVVTFATAQDCTVTLVSPGTKSFAVAYSFNRQVGSTTFPLTTDGTTPLTTLAGDQAFFCVRSTGTVSSFSGATQLMASINDSAPRATAVAWLASAAGGSPETINAILSATFKWTTVLVIIMR